MTLEDKVAVVTGGGSGIGHFICLGLAREKARVVVTDIDGAAAEETARGLSSEGGQALSLKMDITDSTGVKGAVQQVLERWGRVDILVNNAGTDKVEPFIESTEETWDKLLAVNLKGHMLVTRAVLGTMMNRNRGRIIFISSDAGRVGSTGEVVYSAAKAGILGFAKALAREMARYNITVNCVSPGPTDTPLFYRLAQSNPGLAESLIRSIPLRRLGRPQEIAATVVFLASDDAQYITGQTISVSGGLTMI